MTVTKEQTAAIGLGEMKVTKDDSVVLTCLGLVDRHPSNEG